MQFILDLYIYTMDHVAHVFGMEEIVGHILKFLPMKQLHRVARYRRAWGKNTLRNADCGMRNVDHGYFAECGMRKKTWGMRYNLRNGKCGKVILQLINFR